jgi:hypothetical protein
MQDLHLLETVERYLRGEMDSAERVSFELQRKNDPEVDQLVVEHTLFLEQLVLFGERKQFKAELGDIHT